MGYLQEMFSTGFFDTLLRFALCMLVNWSIVKFLYFKKSKRRDFFFTFIIISVAIFFLVYLMMGMDRGKATMGVGLGLFGIFSIMRYRTDTMPVREMTYLFVVVCLSVVHAMAEPFGVNKGGNEVGTPITELLVIDIIVIAAIVTFERTLKVEPSKLVQYDRIELVKPEHYQELVADLEQRLGVKVLKVEVGAVDFLRDMAMLRVYYKADGIIADKEINEKVKLKNSDYANI
jgi:magnesium-transporting ATPase (P-type)